jgi:type 1 glutamine amidotransferase
VRARQRPVWVGAAAVLAACGAGGTTTGLAGPGPGSVSSSKPNVLVLTETRGYHHASIPDAMQALRRLAASDRRYRLTFLPSATVLPGALHGARAVVFLLTSGELPLSEAGKRALVAFVRRGGGLVGFHSASDTFHHWPGFTQMLGAEFSHHPPPSTQRVIVEDQRSPATRTLGRAFSIDEEFYVFKRDPRASAHILERLDTGRGGPDRPLVWCRRQGGGRVFYDALGHFPQTWQDRRQIAIVSGGLAWAIGLDPAPAC